MDLFIEIAVSLLPSLALLLVFILMDSYKLLGIKAVIFAIIIGALSAIVSYFVNTPIVENSGLDWTTYSRYGAPLVEEFLRELSSFILSGPTRSALMLMRRFTVLP